MNYHRVADSAMASRGGYRGTLDQSTRRMFVRLGRKTSTRCIDLEAYCSGLQKFVNSFRRDNLRHPNTELIVHDNTLATSNQVIVSIQVEGFSGQLFKLNH